jgi:ribosomal-protein-alanine N-acetyltransferase
VLRTGFEDAGLDRIVAYTAVANTPSRRVMEKIGMVRDADRDFDHPRIAEESPVRRQVVYVVEREAWRRSLPRVVGA